jgi:hypothetical protein
MFAALTWNFFFFFTVGKGVKHPVILGLLVWTEAEFAADLDKSSEVILKIGESSSIWFFLSEHLKFCRRRGFKGFQEMLHLRK